MEKPNFGEINRIIVSALKDLLETRGDMLPKGNTEDITLLGEDGLLDSMELVTLVVSVEQVVEEQLGATITLANDRALSQRKSPYRTVGSLTEFAVEELLDDVR